MIWLDAIEANEEGDREAALALAEEVAVVTVTPVGAAGIFAVLSALESTKNALFLKAPILCIEKCSLIFFSLCCPNK